MVRPFFLVFRIEFHPGQIQDKILCCILLFTVKSFLSHNDLRFKATHCVIRPILGVTCIGFHPRWIPLPPCLPIQSIPCCALPKLVLSLNHHSFTTSHWMVRLILAVHRISSWMSHLSGRQACPLFQEYPAQDFILDGSFKLQTGMPIAW